MPLVLRLNFDELATKFLVFWRNNCHELTDVCTGDSNCEEQEPSCAQAFVKFSSRHTNEMSA